MNIGFTGHRDKTFDESFLHELAETYPDALWIHGGADGFDTQVDNVAKAHGIKTKEIRPDYKKYADRPRYAPIARNYIIVDESDVIVAGYDGRVKGGTHTTIKYAQSKEKRVVFLKPDARYLLVA